MYELLNFSRVQELAGSPKDGCKVFVSFLARSRLLNELAFVDSVSTALETSGASYAVVISSSASDIEPRFLQSSEAPTTVSVPVPQINATPTILAGLILSLVLILFTAVGLSCISSVETPDVMHSYTLPAGKEY